MATSVNPIPDGMKGLLPYVCVHDAKAAIEFYKQAFGATEVMRINGPGPKIGHAELKIKGSTLMLSDEFPEWGNKSAKTLGGTPVVISFYVEDVDAAFARAIAAGGKQLMPVADQFYGDRSGRLEDPFGLNWVLATHKEDVSAEETQKRAAAMFSGK